MVFNHRHTRTALTNVRAGVRALAAPHGRDALVATVIAIALSSFAADPGITVSARQRYPWNGLVDINFTITGDAGTKYDTSFTAKDMVGNTNIAMRTIRKADGTAAATKEQLLPGNYNWVWDAAADLPKDFKCDRVTVTGTALDTFPYSVKFNANSGTGTMADESFTYGTPKALTANAFKRTGYTFQGWATSASGAKVYNDKQSVSNLTETSGAVVNLYAVWKAALYMVIDLSSGANSSSYPVSYLDAAPSGGFNVNTYKTTKLVLRRIEPGSFKMNGTYNVTLTKPFYIGVFEVTQKQYMLVMGSNPSQYAGDKRPVEKVSYDMIRGSSNGAKWPSSSAVDSSSFMGKLRTRMGLSFDLPTEAQWEYACRAGTTSDYNNGGSSENDMKKLGRYVNNQSDGKGGGTTHTIVGSYLPNDWGLYDMHGNVFEWCLDRWGHLSNGVTDPKGSSSTNVGRIKRGGGWDYVAYICTSSYRSSEGESNSTSGFGFRLCLPLSN